MSWTDTAQHRLQEILASLPADASIADKRKALRDNYPFSMRRGWAYKAWLKVQRNWLARNDPEYAAKMRAKLFKLTGQTDFVSPQHHEGKK